MSSKNSFVHLHVHTEYSMLDGLNRIPLMVKKVKEMGMDSLAISDHGVMHGLHEFWKECKDADIKPIIGCEVYVAPQGRSIKEEINGIRYYHLLLLAKNLKGYQNLIKLVSLGHLEGFYYKPRIDRELIEKYSEGIICSSACPASPLGRHILRDENDKAEEWLNFLHKIFKNDFYLELQRHGYSGADEIPENIKNYPEEQSTFIKEQVKINIQLKEWAKKYSIPLIATTDAHYLEADDDFTQEVLFAIKDGKNLSDPDRRKGYKHTYIKSPEEMAEVFSDLPAVLENTQKLADSVEKYDIGFERVQPKYPDLPKNKTAREYLREITYEGAKILYPDLNSEVRDRIDFELKVIHEKGYDDYFLVVSDIMKWSRERGILVGARGSVGGSVVAYCLEIINIDPIKWELYFERFLNPERPTPPDIDMDIQDTRRDEVIDYVEQKYGHDNVCGVITFGKLKTRAAIRDVARVMNIDLSIADTLSKMVEVTFGKPKSITWMMEHNKEFNSIIESDQKLKDLALVVQRIDGLCRHVSTHACGYLITPTPVTDYIPVQLESGSSDKVITQLESKPLEYLDLMKFDFLGLQNLSIIDYTLKLIEERHNKKIDIYNVPLDDSKTFKLFQDGNTTAIFQFESAGMKRFLKELVPENLEDLCFMAAAYRPGPMQFIQPYIDCKHGKTKAHYLIPELEPILKNTYGFAIYQEQVIRIAVDIAGYSMGQADILRRAMGKKITEVMKAEEKNFVDGCIAKGYSEEIAKKLFEFMLPFADYGFNKSHSATYAVIGYWTAYLKAHYPIEFMSARLSSVMNHPDKLIVALEEVRSMGIQILPPDINKSAVVFSPEGEKSIRYGLDGVKNVGKNIVEELVEDRDKNGLYKNLDDFCLRIQSVNSRTLDALIKVGAMNTFGNQNALLKIYPEVLSKRSKDKKAKNIGQLDIFSTDGSDSKTIPEVAITQLPEVPEIPTSQKLIWEKELLGVYFSSHPLQGVQKKLNNLGIVQITESGIEEGKVVTGGCVISKIKNITTKKGDPMAFITLEDLGGTIESVLFPTDYENYKGKITEGDTIIVTGKCNSRNGEISLIISKIQKVNGDEEVAEDKLSENKYVNQNVNVQRKAHIILNEDADSNDISQLRDILLENPGETEVILVIGKDGMSKKYKMKKGVDYGIIQNVISKLPLVSEIIL